MHRAYLPKGSSRSLPPVKARPFRGFSVSALERDPYPVLLYPDDPTFADQAIFFSHQLKAIWNEGCVWNIDSCAFRGNVQHATTSTRATACEVSNLINLRSWMFSSFVAEPNRTAAVCPMFFFQINGHVIHRSYQK